MFDRAFERYQQIARSAVRRMPTWLAGRARGWRWRRRRSWLTQTGWVYLAVWLIAFGGAWLRDSNGLLLLSGMLSGPLLVSYWLPRRTLAKLVVARQMPESIHAVEPLSIELTVTNRRRWISALMVELHDACRYDGPLADVKVAGSKILLPHLAPRETCRLTYEGALPVRGRFEFGPLSLSTAAPLGLIRHRRIIDLPAKLIAWPRLGRLTPAGAQLARHSDLALQRVRRRQTRMEVDFHGLRDWRPGDSRRWIHWRSTARRGQIVVRQFDTARGHDVALFVDLFQPANSDTDWADKVETALSLAATLVTDVCRRGGCRLVLVVAGGQTIRLDGRASGALARQSLQQLALVPARTSEAVPADFVESLASVPPSCTVVLVATRAVDLDHLTSEAQQPLAQATRTRIQTITVGAPEMAHYFCLP